MIDLFTRFGQQKPNRNITESKKDKEYHIKYAKYCLGASNSSEYRRFMYKYSLNKHFYKGDQWTLPEDVEAFLKDESGQDKNRIKIVANKIRPMVEQYKGNAKSLIINHDVFSVSPKSITRREQKLAEKTVMYAASKMVPPEMAQSMKESEVLGDTVQENTDIFQNMYVDPYIEGMNRLVRYIAQENEIHELHVKMAESLALSGLVSIEGYRHGSELKFELRLPNEIIFDTTSKRPDLSDAEFQGVVMEINSSELFEIYDLTQAEVDAIEAFLTSNQNSTNRADAMKENQVMYANSKIFTAKIFWRDYEYIEYGYVESDLSDEPKLEKINYVYDGEEEPRYTEEDLVDVPKGKPEYIKSRFKGKKKYKMPTEIIRYCIFIPEEIISARLDRQNEEKAIDIVLEHGVYDFQEIDHNHPTQSKFPIKHFTWGYLDGEILSPIDDVINPQRFINRVLSATESQINNSGGTNVVIDKGAVDPQDGEDEIMRNTAQGKPIMVNSRGKGIPNVVSSYDATPKAGTYQMFEILPIISGIIKDTTGVNEALQGQSIGQDQLVGVTNALMQRGSLMQEAFYFAIEKTMHQCYQMMCSVGKKLYIDNFNELVTRVGNDKAEILKLSKDWLNEDFRVFLKRTGDQQMMQEMADQVLTMLLQMGLIDDTMFADMYGRSTPEQVNKALRENAIAKKIAAKQEAKMQQEQQQQIAQQESEAMEQMAIADSADKMRQDEMEMAKLKEKGQQAIDQEFAKGIAKNVLGGNESQNRVLQ